MHLVMPHKLLEKKTNCGSGDSHTISLQMPVRKNVLNKTTVRVSGPLL